MAYRLSRLAIASLRYEPKNITTPILTILKIFPRYFGHSSTGKQSIRESNKSLESPKSPLKSGLTYFWKSKKILI
jgi:hypothetical protein